MQDPRTARRRHSCPLGRPIRWLRFSWRLVPSVAGRESINPVQCAMPFLRDRRDKQELLSAEIAKGQPECGKVISYRGVKAVLAGHGRCCLRNDIRNPSSILQCFGDRIRFQQPARPTPPVPYLSQISLRRQLFEWTDRSLFEKRHGFNTRFRFYKFRACSLIVFREMIDAAK